MVGIMSQALHPNDTPTTTRKVLLPQDALPEIEQLCHRFNVKKVVLFGSANTDTFDPERSDIDLIIEFDKSAKVDLVANYFDMHAALQKLFGRRVDMMTKTTIENPYLRRSVELNHRQLYPVPE